MSIRMQFHLEGLDRTDDVVRDAAHIGLERGAEYVKAAAQEKAPVESGDLKGSIDVRDRGILEFDVYVPGPYARFQEFGPHFNPEVLHHEEGQSPYLSAAVDEERERVLQVIADSIREGLGG